MRRRATTLLALAVMAVVFAGGCPRRRARNGACTAHIDCDPGYDCRDHRCVKRPPFPGTTQEPAPTPPAAAPPAPAPPQSEPARPSDTPPAPPRPHEEPLPPPSNVPTWKARLKSI